MSLHRSLRPREKRLKRSRWSPMSVKWPNKGRGYQGFLYFKIKRGSTKHQEHQGPSGWKLRQSAVRGRGLAANVRAKKALDRKALLSTGVVK